MSSGRDVLENQVFPAFILSQSGRAVKYTWGARRRGGGAAAEKFSLFHKKDAAFLLTAGPGSGIIRGVRKAKCLYKGAGGESGGVKESGDGLPAGLLRRGAHRQAAGDDVPVLPRRPLPQRDRGKLRHHPAGRP